MIRRTIEQHNDHLQNKINKSSALENMPFSVSLKDLKQKNYEMFVITDVSECREIDNSC